jgi:antitoxin component of RelBE/YafQ-DinJ toxin-antitoxin module
MSYPNVLVNFRIPVALKNEFEDACKRLHMPMTAQANLLMREFVNRQKHARNEPNELNEPVSFYSGMDDPL